jgi:hypothetical protein
MIRVIQARRRELVPPATADVSPQAYKEEVIMVCAAS